MGAQLGSEDLSPGMHQAAQLTSGCKDISESSASICISKTGCPLRGFSLQAPSVSREHLAQLLTLRCAHSVCCFAVVLQWGVRASGLPPRRHRRQLGSLEFLGELLADVRHRRAKRGAPVQQPHVSERSRSGWMESEPPRGCSQLTVQGQTPPAPSSASLPLAQAAWILALQCIIQINSQEVIHGPRGHFHGLLFYHHFKQLSCVAIQAVHGMGLSPTAAVKDWWIEVLMRLLYTSLPDKPRQKA